MSVPVVNGYPPSCRNWICTVSVLILRNNLRSGKNTQSKIYCNGTSRQSTPIKSGSAVTCFKVNGYWLYFYVILDPYSRKVIGCKVSRNASTQLVTSTFKAAYEKREQPQNLTFHSDRGKQHTSAAFSELLQKYRVRQSFSASGRPMITRLRRPSSPHSKRRRLTAGIIHRNRGFEKTLSGSLRSITRSGRTEHWHIRLPTVLRKCITSMRNPVYEKAVFI